LKNFNFSVFTALYILSLGWAFTHTKDILFFLMFAYLTSPLLWLAFYSQGRRIGKFYESEMKSKSLVSHLVALVCSALLLAFVIKSMTATKFGPIQFFQNLRMGWSFKSAAELLALDLALAASALTIWSGYGFTDAKKGLFKGKGPRLFFAGLKEHQRFLIYFYLVILFWVIGTMSLSLIWKDYSLRFLTIVTARALVPAIALLLIAVLRLPFMMTACMGILILIGYLLKINLSINEAFAFVGIPLVAAVVFFAVRYFMIPEAGVEPAASVAAPIAEASVAEPKTEAENNE